MQTRALIRLTTVGVIIATTIAGSVWFWIGIGLTSLVVAGMAGASHRPAVPWAGGLAILMWILVHQHWILPSVGVTLAVLSGLTFVVLWSRGPGKPRRRALVLDPHVLRRQAG